MAPSGDGTVAGRHRRAIRAGAARLGAARPVAARLGAACISLGICALGLELGLRAFWDGYYLKGEHAYAEPHPTRGWHNIPGASVPYGEPEFRIRVTHNSRGFRGPELRPRSQVETRVLLLGDSFAYGIGAEDDETLSARLEQLAPALEVVNAGVNGYGTGQELLVLEEEGPSLEPDVVVLLFFWNDVANNVERESHHFALVDGAIVRPAPLEVLPAVSATPRRHPWLRHSYLYRYTSDRLKSARFWARDLLGLPHEDGDRLPPERREAAWALERALLVAMRDQATALGAQLLIAIVPEQVQVQPDAHVLGLVEDDYQIQARLLALGESEGIPVVDLLPPLRAAYEASAEPLYYRQDRHLTPPGIALAAREILDELGRRGWVPPGSRGAERAPSDSRDERIEHRGDGRTLGQEPAHRISMPAHARRHGA